MEKFDNMSADDLWSTTDDSYDDDGDEASEAQEETGENQPAEVR